MTVQTEQTAKTSSRETEFSKKFQLSEESDERAPPMREDGTAPRRVACQNREDRTAKRK